MVGKNNHTKQKPTSTDVGFCNYSQNSYTCFSVILSYKNSMPDNLILFLFLGLFLGIIGWILFVILGKFLKWELKIKIPKRTYSFGEEIKGIFTLHAKKTINGDDLSVHLVGYKRESSYDKDGRKNTRRVEVARFSQIIESGKLYDSGLKRDYDFLMQIPVQEEIFGENLDNIDLWNSTLGKLAKYALKHVPKTQITWQVQVDLEATGLDIHGKKDIFIQKST